MFYYFKLFNTFGRANRKGERNEIINNVKEIGWKRELKVGILL
jgi:hypothetical protein